MIVIYCLLITAGLIILVKIFDKPEKTSICDPDTCLGFKTLHQVTSGKKVPQSCGFYDSCKIARACKSIK